MIIVDRALQVREEQGKPIREFSVFLHRRMNKTLKRKYKNRVNLRCSSN